ncbi:hypothetical protein HMPREF1531_02498 [Propionibacterium sp. oral taxon 192 str. F0372]|uniref:S9 family peptidase n=1 Tax=Propionibacterium sp. oral taxon 192 TaxID=671222 RepID=UPI00035376E3|nr:prolyl oligopeptidase family serine peptidase [Propionibacterium sp. oral taxon 192]EPH00389.1 hypothetical protein HMPREF1531_02498 [Propionibacterium sp. oral taxon 192 str. F0372]
MTASQVARYGTWTSPLTAASVVAASGTMSCLIGDQTGVWWLESTPQRKGYSAVMRFADGIVTQMTGDEVSVRSRVNEYGGGAFDACDGYLVHCDDATSRLLVREPDGTIRPLTSADPLVHYGDLRIHPDRGLVLAVREDHHVAGQAETTLVAIDLVDSTQHILAQGADFYANPALSPDGLLAWLEWNQPVMPWHSTLLYCGQLTPEGVVDVELVAGIPQAVFDGIGVHHPRWVEVAGRHLLMYTSDASGYFTLMLHDGEVARPLGNPGGDVDKPMFVIGNHAHAQLADGSVLGQLVVEGQHFLQLTRMDGTVRRLGGVAGVDSVAAHAGVGYALIDRPACPRSLVRLNPDGSLTELRSLGAPPDPGMTSVARSIVMDGHLGSVQMWYYPPTNDAHRAPEGTRPPALVRVHGGPTAMATNAYDPVVQFWTSRGIAVADVNYSGSVGFGKAYRDRLDGLWGIADVTDCTNAAEALVDAGLADPARIIISGGSAGGFTALRALMLTDVFAAGITRYGVTDLAALVGGHKFEARYLDSLVGPWPAERALYEDRSPINGLDHLNRPILVLQGDEDPVVPLAQATTLAEAVRRRGLPMAMIVFAGEGHGFRSPAVRQQALEAEFSFCDQLFGLNSNEVPRLKIENLG